MPISTKKHGNFSFSAVKKTLPPVSGRVVISVFSGYLFAKCADNTTGMPNRINRIISFETAFCSIIAANAVKNAHSRNIIISICFFITSSY